MEMDGLELLLSLCQHPASSARHHTQNMVLCPVLPGWATHMDMVHGEAKKGEFSPEDLPSADRALSAVAGIHL